MSFSSTEFGCVSVPSCPNLQKEIVIGGVTGASCVLLIIVLIRVPYYDCWNHALDMFGESQLYVTEGIFSILICISHAVDWSMSKRLFVYALREEGERRRMKGERRRSKSEGRGVKGEE